MPVNRKRTREEKENEEKAEVENVKKQNNGSGSNSGSANRRLSTKCYFQSFNIGYCEDQWHTLIRTIPTQVDELIEVISKVICSFLNGLGGILCFGCRTNGRIYGEEISRHEEDNLRLIIDDTLKKFHPFVSPNRYRVCFTPVKSSMSNYTLKSHYVLEVKIERGEKYELYETDNHEVYLRKDDKPYGPLSPHEIKRHVVQQYKKKLEDTKLRDNFESLKPKKTNNGPSHPLSVSKKYTCSDAIKSVTTAPVPTSATTVTITSSSSNTTVTIPTVSTPTVTTTL